MSENIVTAAETRAQATATVEAPRTYPMGRRPGGDRSAISARIASVQAELAAGNVTSAVKTARYVSGHCARHGEQRVASLVRHAVRATHNGQHTEAHNLLAEADSHLSDI
ncbi:MAG: hypothetical protein IT306_24155 [Chloroflexi bacterium]|nr:hypothetical protein [Chloroflexota bacterium]